MLSFWFKLLPPLVKVKLLLAKAQSLAVSLENADKMWVGVQKTPGSRLTIKACHLVDIFLKTMAVHFFYCNAIICHYNKQAYLIETCPTALIIKAMGFYCAYLKSDHLHAKNWAVKTDGIWHTFHCKHQMIQMAHFNGTASFVFDCS